MSSPPLARPVRPGSGAAAVSPRARSLGFSLLEILLVVALIAGATALAAVAMGGGFDRIAWRSAGKTIAAQLRYTRAQAIATGEPQRFEFDTASRTWRAPGGRSGTIPEPLEVEFTGAREIQSGTTGGAIVFFADGAATGGRVRVLLRDAAWQVDVAWLTGQVRLSRGDNER